MATEAFRPRGVERLILGTMRLHEIDRTVDQWLDFFATAFRLGVRTLHSSSEYDSFPLLREILERLRREHRAVDFRHMVKLGDPHFNEELFDAERFSARVDGYRSALGSERVDNVQWMWRSDLDADGQRIDRFREAADQIGSAADKLKAAGWIGRLFCFPYSPGFAEAALDERAIDGLAVYRNAQESDYDPTIERAGEFGKPCIIIRPFNAGKVFEGGKIGPITAIRSALTNPAIEAAVLSTSNIVHLQQLVHVF